MARRAKPLTLKVTHEYVNNPAAVERGLQAWAAFLAEHLAHEAPAAQDRNETEPR